MLPACQFSSTVSSGTPSRVSSQCARRASCQPSRWAPSRSCAPTSSRPSTPGPLTKHQFTHYYSGASVAFGICIDTTWRLDNPVSLAVLRRCWLPFTPPQCFRYLGAKEMRMAKSFNVNVIPSKVFNEAKSTFPLFEQHSRLRAKARSCDSTLQVE